MSVEQIEQIEPSSFTTRDKIKFGAALGAICVVVTTGIWRAEIAVGDWRHSAEDVIESVEREGYSEPEITSSSRSTYGSHPCRGGQIIRHEVLAINDDNRPVALIACVGATAGLSIHPSQ